MMPGNPIVGGVALRRPAIESPNFVTGVSGWAINQDGSAEFNNLSFRGTFNGTNFIINSTGAYFYSGTPAAGNLIGTEGLTAAGSDGFGNAVLPGTVNYGASGGVGLAVQMFNGQLQFYSGPLSGAGPWAQFGNFEGSLWLSGGANITLGATPSAIGPVGAVSTSPLAPAALSPLTTGAIANSVAETVIGTFTIPANDPIAGSGYRFRVYGGASDVLTPTLTFRFRLTNATGTVFMTGLALTCITSASMRYSVDGWLYFNAVGAAGKLRASGILSESIAATAPALHSLLGGDTTGVDTTSPVVLCVTAQWSAASPSNNCVTFNGSMERIIH